MLRLSRVARESSSALFGQREMGHVNASRAETGLAIGEIIFPHIAEACIKTQCLNFRPDGNETRAPCSQRARIIKRKVLLSG